MKHKGNFKQWFNVFVVISEAWKGYESKAYGVSNHYLKLRPKKFSRTRDIPNFPTQGWGDTAFYTSNWNLTYFISISCHNSIIIWGCHDAPTKRLRLRDNTPYPTPTMKNVHPRPPSTSKWTILAHAEWHVLRTQQFPAVFTFKIMSLYTRQMKVC